MVKNTDIRCFEAAGERIMEDFVTFMDYLDNDLEKVSSKTYNLGKNDCFALNQRLKCVPEKQEKPGRNQENYAEIDFFHYFCVRTGIYCVCKEGKNIVLRAQKRKLSFLQLAPADCYCLMLASAMSEYLPAKKALWGPADHLRRFLMNNKKTKVAGNELKPDGADGWGDDIYYQPSYRLFQLFNIMRIEWAVNEKGRVYIGRLFSDECGISIARNGYLQLRSNIFDVDDTFLKNFLMGFKPCLQSSPEALTAFFKPEKPVFTGSYIIKLSHGRCMRKYRMDFEDTLEKLHNLIQVSIAFDDDHLYYFEVGMKPFSTRYYSTDCNEMPPATDKVKLNELGLTEGCIFQYLFDFGDQWLFELQVEKIIPERTENAAIVDEKGDAPIQYPNYDDGWF